MFFCDKIEGKRRCFNICYCVCGNSRASHRGSCSEARIPSCNCQSNVGCLDRSDYGGLRSSGTAATGTCPGPCQCVEEEIWNSNVPPKPNCRWLNNFAELRRQWSDYGRQQACKCCNCSPSCKTVAPGRLCLSPTPPCSGTILTASDCQKCCGSRRLAGGASKSEMTSINKSSSPERPLKREAGGGCQCCAHPSICCNSSNANCSSTATSCCPSQCRYSQVSSRQTPDCQSCTSPAAPKSIWKKRICCQCNTSYCLCQPMSRGCNCPPSPVQIDGRTARECSCNRPSSPECACLSGEQRFQKTTIKCPNVRLCCPFSRLPSASKCHCARCQSCPPPVCHPCTTTKCRGSIPPKDSCYSRLPTSYLPCRPASAASSHPPTPRKNLTFCTKRGSRPSSPCTGTGQSLHGCVADDRNSENSIYKEGNDIEKRENDMKDCDDLCDCCCATESENGSDHVDDLLEERFELESLTSNVLINSSETTKPSKSVDPDLLDMPKKKVSTPTTPTCGIDRRRREWTNVTRGMVHPVGVSCTSERTSRSTFAPTHEKKNKHTKESACCNVFSNLGGIGYSTLVPSPLALVSFVLLILIAVTWSSGLAFYHRFLLRKKFCRKYL